jgi:hypothetical protein
MKKWLVAGLVLSVFFLVSCGGSAVVDKPAGPWVKVAQKVDPKIYPLYSELYGGGVKMTLPDGADSDDTKVYIWNGMKQYLMTNSTDHPVKGNLFLRIVVGMGVDWFGWGIHVAPRSFQSMSDYKNGHLKFWVRTKGSGKFKLGVKHGFATESWMNIDEGKYGFKADGNWNPVSIPLSDFVPKINFGTVNIYWMMAQGIGQSPQGGSVYDLTEIYWTKD